MSLDTAHMQIINITLSLKETKERSDEKHSITYKKGEKK